MSLPVWADPMHGDETDRKEARLKGHIQSLERLVFRSVHALRHAQHRRHDFTLACRGCSDLLGVLDDAIDAVVE